VQQASENFNYINDVKNILIPTGAGENVPLSELATITIEETPTSIERSDNERYLTIS